MISKEPLDTISQAVADPPRKRRLSAVWIIPVLAALVALGIAVERFMNEGPTITITFRKAEGLEEGKTFIRYKEVNIGQVTKVRLSDDYQNVLVTAKISKSAEKLIVEDAKFWVVQPRVSISGVSGISTLLSGNYIGFEPGKSDKPHRRFTGIEAPPVIESTEPGKEFVLRADDLGSLGIGSPVYFRRLNVGQVIGYDLSEDGKSVRIKIFISSPFDRQVKTNTKFWQASGIDVAIDGNGLAVQTQSVLSVLIGGIAFSPHPAESEGEPAEVNSVFPLYNDRVSAYAQHETIIDSYVLYFSESLRGLNIGAPVTFLGLPVGEVTNVRLEFSPSQSRVTPRVDISIYPERLLSRVKRTEGGKHKIASSEARKSVFNKQVERGLRGQLRTSSLLTGQLYVALDYFPNSAPVKVDWKQQTPELPVVPSGMADLQIKINAVLTKLEKMPVDDVSKELRELILKIDKLTAGINEEVMPEFKKTMLELKKAVLTAQRLMENTDASLMGRDAPAQQELRQALQEIARAARAISMLTEYLERNPNALIRGKSQEKPQ